MYSSFSGFPAPSLPVDGDSPPWPGGVLAAGSILVSSPAGVPYSCRIGRDDGGGDNPCGCGPPEDNPCVIAAPCWGDLCDVSRDALHPNTTYLVRDPRTRLEASLTSWRDGNCVPLLRLQVYLSTAPIDGVDSRDSVTELPPITTAGPYRSPFLSSHSQVRHSLELFASADDPIHS